MYKLSTLMFTLLMGVVLFTSCKKDETPAPSVEENTLSFMNEKYVLSRAYGREYDNGPEATVGYSLSLLSEEGRESVLLLFNVPNGDNIEGTYTPTHPSGEEPSTFTSVGIEIGYDPVTEEQGEIYRTQRTPEGKIIIKKSGSSYIVDFDVTMDDGQKARGNYKGTIQKQ